jgi:hypothetical protein
MRRTRGSMGRAISGGVIGSALIGAAAVVDGGDDKLGVGIVVGAIFGVVVGVIVGAVVFMRLVRNPVFYFVAGGIIGAATVVFLTNLDTEMEVGHVIAPTIASMISGAIFGGIISVLISRGIAR